MQAIGDRRCQSSTKEGSALPGWWSYPNTPEVYRCQKDKHPQAGLETEPPLMTAAGHNNVHNPYYLEHNGLWVGRGGGALGGGGASNITVALQRQRQWGSEGLYNYYCCLQYHINRLLLCLVLFLLITIKLISKGSSLVGALSPINHKGLHQGWKQTSIHLPLIQHKSHKTAKFFKIHKIGLDKTIKENIQRSTTIF